MSASLKDSRCFAREYTRQQSGSSLIEVLIAMVIAAFALLAMAGLQLNTMRYQHVAHYRTLAAVLSADLVERVRANRDGARDGQYNPALESYPSLATNDAALDCADAAFCTGAEIAGIDLQEWRTALGRAMAGGWGEISGSVAQGFVVRVYYQEHGMQEDGLRQNDCRMAALSAADKNVRCFVTHFSL